MVFKCQQDCFLRELTTIVVSCEPASIDWIPPDELNPIKVNGFNVICEDTILFPAGGGQPCDYGTINGKPVRDVIRKGDTAVHFIETIESLEVGATVKQVLDWERRLDHMQQHSCQHLLTALFEREFNYNTISWSLKQHDGFIELDTKHVVSREALDTVEKLANKLIFEGRAVTVLNMDLKTANEVKDLRVGRNLPNDIGTIIRVIDIDGIDKNMCCGTHISNLTQLMCIKLLSVEKWKRSVYVYFAAGGRVMSKLAACIARERDMNKALNCAPKQHLDVVYKLNNTLRTLKKTYSNLLCEAANNEIEKLNNMKPLPKYYSVHRKDGLEMDFIHTFLRNAPENVFYFITDAENVPTDATANFVLKGDTQLINEFAVTFMDLLNGRGNGRENYFQGKISNLKNIYQCEEMLEQYFNPPKRALAKPSEAEQAN